MKESVKLKAKRLDEGGTQAFGTLFITYSK